MTALTAEQIDAMEAGPELDVLIAEKVMGLKVRVHEFGQWVFSDGKQEHREMKLYWIPEGNRRTFSDGAATVPKYSTDIAAAFRVAESLGLFHPMKHNRLLFQELIGDELRWAVGYQFWEQIDTDAWGETPALAICRAALKLLLTDYPQR